MKLKILLFFSFLLVLTLAAPPTQKIEIKNNNLIYHKFWNLYNGGFVTRDGLPGLTKSAADQAEWKATMKLNTLKVMTQFLGRRLYFITETEGDPVARLAPTFYVLKDKKEYVVWWDEQKITDPAKIQRKYINFAADASGQIIGFLDIPGVAKGNFYALDPATKKAYRITDKTPINLADIRNGLRTDWQHDIPGAYQITQENKFPGRYGTVVFTRFYLGLIQPEPVFQAGRDDWIRGVALDQQQVLAHEFDLSNFVFVGNTLAENQYFIGRETVQEIKDYYQENKTALDKDPYFQKQNFIKCGDTARSWTLIAKDPETQLSFSEGRYTIQNKSNSKSWFIVSLGSINDPEVLKKLRGVARLSAEFMVRGLVRGDLDWQTVYLDVVQKDGQGNEVGFNDEVKLPVNRPDFAGIFENEFIITSKTTALDIYLKIAGTPDNAPDKAGVKLSELNLDKVLLTKPEPVLNLNKLFKTAAADPIEKKEINGRQIAYYNPAGTGIYIGDRLFKLDPENKKLEINLAGSSDYSAFYTNIFDVNELSELELAANFSGAVVRHGEPPDWASLCVEVSYYDQDGRQVYAADYGEEKYPKIGLDPRQKKQTRKNFFSIPHERGARYAQLKLHALRAVDKNDQYDTKNYFTGTFALEDLVARPALELNDPKNFAPDGSFYKHINGLPINWTGQGIRVEEDIRAQRRVLIYENTADNWSALKTQFAVPENATALRGFLNLNIEKIETGLAPWEGFGFFIEADVADQQGNTFHYSGIPVYQKVKDQLVRLERIPLPIQGILEYYVPLNHEQLKMKNITWQLALYGKGLVKLLPLDPKAGANPELVRIEFLTDGESPNNPALWSQFGLYSADNDGFTFQKNYELKISEQTYRYEFAEALNEHLAGYLKKEINYTPELRALNINEEKKFGEARIKALPSYARVSKELKLDPELKYLYLSFNLQTPDQGAKYNFKAMLIDETGNTLEIPFLRLTGLNKWQVFSAVQDVFELGKNGPVEILLPVENKSFPAKAVRLILGSNQGEIKFSKLKILALSKLPVAIDTGKTAAYQFLLDKKNARLLYEQKALTSPALFRLQTMADQGLNNADLQAADPAKPFVPPIDINSYPALQKLDQAIRLSVKSNGVFSRQGSWYFDNDRKFIPVGFTIVGETFSKWFDLRRAEFKAKTKAPYWSAALTAAEQTAVAGADDEKTYIKFFIKAQARLWQRAGYNMVRVHQLHTNWSNLTPEDTRLVYALLKILQKEEGFIIDVDLLPNLDLTSDYFKPALQSKEYAADLTQTNDLFKAVLVLPEVRENYVKPVIGQILQDFQAINFWPNSLSFCNETGFTHGYWTIDKNNPAHHPYFSRMYAFYYEQFLNKYNSFKLCRQTNQRGQELIQKHWQTAQLKNLLENTKAVKNIIKSRNRVKDNAGFVYYNVLRADIVAQYPAYAAVLTELRNSFKDLAEAPANIDFYKNIESRVKVIEEKIGAVSKAIAAGQQANLKDLQTLLQTPGLAQELQELSAAVFEHTMPGDYRIPEKFNFEYIDTYSPLNENQLKQSFFTSFLLPVAFSQEIAGFIRQKAPAEARYSLGLNNDFIRDVNALLANCYLFSHDEKTEQRFNKYAHHPVGGHSMLLHSGFGNIFADDSNVNLNLELFTPLLAGYPARISETNFTFVGGDNSGEGPWTVLDWLKVIARQSQISGFHLGRNNVDNPVIRDYFDIGNRPFKLIGFNLVAVTALQKALDQDFVRAQDFLLNAYSGQIFLSSKKISALAGTVARGRELANNQLKFRYTGERERTDLTITRIALAENKYLVSFYGIDRNNRQINRRGNPDLVQSFGTSPIVYQKIEGILSVKLGAAAGAEVSGIDPAGQEIKLDPSAYALENDWLQIDTSRTGRKIVSYKITLKK